MFVVVVVHCYMLDGHCVINERSPGGLADSGSSYLISSQEHEDKIRRRRDILAGQRHAHEEWQYHHWKAAVAAKTCKKRGFTSVARWLRGDASYGDTPQCHGCTLEYCMFVDYLKEI